LKETASWNFVAFSIFRELRVKIMDSEALQSRNSSLLIEERLRKDIVIGVPHHAPAGTPTLPCPEHPDSDENAGFLGRYLAEKLDCCSVIACNSTIDPNKSGNSRYATQIAQWKPKVLIEIHGHGGKRAHFNVEISSGSTINDKYSDPMATKLAALIAGIPGLERLTIGGKYSELHFKASKTATITDSRWIAYHMELPPELRKSSGAPGAMPPDIGYKFCDAVKTALRELHGL
jgi:hypothetical protein